MVFNLGVYAKAIAAFVVPFIAAGVAWVTERSGIDVAFDPSLAEQVVLALISAASVYGVTNKSPEPAPVDG